jgi:hypothetical protein
MKRSYLKNITRSSFFDLDNYYDFLLEENNELKIAA